MNYQLIPLLSILILMFHAFSLPLYKRKKSVYRNNLIVAATLMVMSFVSLFYVVQHGSYVFNFGQYV